MARSLPRIFEQNRPIRVPHAKLGAATMPLSAIVVDIAPDPVAIAQHFEGRPGFAFLHGAADGETGRRSFVAVDPCERSTGWLPDDARGAEPARGAPLASGISRTAIDARGPTDSRAASVARGEGARRAASVARGEGVRRAASAERGEGARREEDTRRDVPRWIGAIPYESARGLERAAWTRTPDDRHAPHFVQPCWQRYGAVIEVDAAQGLVRVVGDDEPAVARLAAELRRAGAIRRERAPVRLQAIAQDDSPHAHLERIHQAKELIEAGDLYQVNLARLQRFATEGGPLDVYLAMAEHAPALFGVCVDFGETAICASSPELFLAIDPVTRRVQTAPIKGTRPRGRDAETDADLRRELDESAKERAELTMILDVERNDLGKICVAGSVRLLTPPRVQTHPTIHHRAAMLAGVLREGTTPLDALKAMFPSGSVTGAPKVRAMEVIARLEPARRGLYTGAFGYVAHGGAVRLAMAIRVLTLKEGQAHYFAGGGIVADSDPEAELEETRWKGSQVERLVSNPPSSRVGIREVRSAPGAGASTGWGDDR